MKRHLRVRRCADELAISGRGEYERRYDVWSQQKHGPAAVSARRAVSPGSTPQRVGAAVDPRDWRVAATGWVVGVVAADAGAIELDTMSLEANPVRLNLKKDEKLEIEWQDGLTSVYSISMLR